MAMRYLIRRNNADDLEDIIRTVPHLNEVLGTAAEDLKRSVPAKLDAPRSVVFHFLSRKTADSYKWVCPTVELVAENEVGIIELAGRFGVPTPEHLKHL